MVNQFIQKTGLSKRAITKSLQSLVNKSLIQITDYDGTILRLAKSRKGKSYLYYSFVQPAHFATSTSAQKALTPAHKRAHNKSNMKKEKETKEKLQFAKHISSLISQSRVFATGA